MKKLLLPSLYCVLVIIAGVFMSACHNAPQQTDIGIHESKEHSLSSELQTLYDLSSLPEYRVSTYVAQVSSYDTTWKNDDGFSGKYSFLRRNADSTLVIFDLKGSGVINRIWTPTPTEDTLDFFVDQDLSPTFSVKFSDLFSGNQFPFVAPLCGNQLGGFFCYLPIPFSKSCRIVSRGKKIQFLQIQYRLYETDARVRSFNPVLKAEEKEALDKIALIWNNEKKSVNDFYPAKISEVSSDIELKPGETKSIFSLDNGGRILGIEIDPAAAFEGLKKNIDIRITWDGESNPAVFSPLADFFGYGFGSTSMRSLLLGSEDNKNYCYFPMPFDTKANIELVYRDEDKTNQKSIRVHAKIWYSTDKRVAGREGKFYAHWNRPMKSESGKPHVFLQVNGKGHYVGTILQAQGMQAGMTYFFEGDDSTAIDGSFRMHGTGSEDYFNGGWYALMDRWEGKMSLPTHGALDYSLPFCRTGGYRFFIGDKLSFEESFYHSMEHGPVGNKFPVEYTSLGLYYSDSPAEKIIEPVATLTTVFLPDTLYLYPQLFDYNVFGDLDIKVTWKYGTGGQSYILTPALDSWLRISLKEIPDGKYQLFLDVMKEPFGCEVSLWQRQTQVTDWVATYGTNEERVKDIDMGEVDIQEFKNTLTFRFRTDQKKTGFVLNRIKLIRKR